LGLVARLVTCWFDAIEPAVFALVEKARLSCCSASVWENARAGLAGGSVARGCRTIRFRATLPAMSTLAEIEAAADSLSSEEKEELLRFLAMRLQKDRAMPKPRIYSDEELASMLAEDQRAGEGPVVERGKGKASEWLRAAKGAVRVAAGESADDARMSYYAAKYGLTR
jgi:hypothetical protein